MSRLIAIASGKGGVGKTTLTANLGIAIAARGKKVIMLDADVDMANLELVLGMEGRPITLQDVIAGEANVRDALYETHNGALFMPAGISPNQYKRIDPEKLVHVVHQLAELADIVLLDCPAGTGKDTLACFSACKETILVVTPDKMSAADAYKTQQASQRMGSETTGLIVNMVMGDKSEVKDNEIGSLLNSPILGRISLDTDVKRSVTAGKPIIVSSPQNANVLEMQKIAASLTGVAYIHETPKKSWLTRMFGFLKFKRGDTKNVK